MKTLKNIYTLIVILFLVHEYLSQKSKIKRNKHKDPKEIMDSWDVVDETSWESFPASDPPGRY